MTVRIAAPHEIKSGDHVGRMLERCLASYLEADGEPGSNTLAHHPSDISVRYGKVPEWRFLKNMPGRELAAVPREHLLDAIHKCHQTLAEGGRRSPTDVFAQFCTIAFLKYRDEKKLDRKDGEPYRFQRGKVDTDQTLARRIHELYADEKSRNPGIFTDDLDLDPAVLSQCVEHLQSISLDRTELDAKGVAFESALSGLYRRDFGRYFTPRELIAFALEVLTPQPSDVILDPACGTGAFLLYAIDHVRREADLRFPHHATDPLQNAGHSNLWRGFAQNNLFGIEVNEELFRVAKMNMTIHGEGHCNIVSHDALDFFDNLQERNEGLAAGSFDLILTNPPFGLSIKRAEKSDGYIDQYELQGYLGKKRPKTKARPSSVKAEVLYLERIHTFLKPGTGRAAVVLPDGILSNSSLQGVRDWLLKRFDLLAVVSLPQSAFQHYGAAVKSSIVFLRRLAEGETLSDDCPIFMAITENIGYDSTGSSTLEPVAELEKHGRAKVAIQRSDLFDYIVYYDWSPDSPRGPWCERRREVIPGTGLVGQWREFQRDPTPFFK